VSEAVLDASALIAYLFDEPGAGTVSDALLSGAIMSTVNFSEVLSKLVDRGVSVDRSISDLRQSGILDLLEIADFTASLAKEAALLREYTRDMGLSLGDRACLALARLRRVPALTADSLWAKVPGAVVRLIR
jgi:ribonuclease VapC